MRTEAFFRRTIVQCVWMVVSLFSVDILSGTKGWSASSSHDGEAPYVKRKYPVDTWENLQTLPLSHHHFVEHHIKHHNDKSRVTIWQEGYTGFWHTLVGAEKYMGEVSHLNLFMESIQHKSAHDLYQHPPKDVTFQNPVRPKDDEMLIGEGLNGSTMSQNHTGMLKALTDWMLPQEEQAHALPKGAVRSCVERGIQEESWTLFHLMMSEQALLSQMEQIYTHFVTQAQSLYDLIHQGKEMHDALAKAVLTDEVRQAAEQEFNTTTHALDLGLRHLERDREKRRLFVNTLRDNFRLPDGRDTSWTFWNLSVKANITYSWRDQFMTSTLNPITQPHHVQTVYAMFEEHVIQGNEDRRNLIFGSRKPIFGGVFVKNAASSVSNTHADNDV